MNKANALQQLNQEMAEYRKTPLQRNACHPPVQRFFVSFFYEDESPPTLHMRVV
jgi:hypothetical protein